VGTGSTHRDSQAGFVAVALSLHGAARAAVHHYSSCMLDRMHAGPYACWTVLVCMLDRIPQMPLFGLASVATNVPDSHSDEVDTISLHKKDIWGY
jgi:hypothetical protein